MKDRSFKRLKKRREAARMAEEKKKRDETTKNWREFIGDNKDAKIEIIDLGKVVSND